MGKRFAKQLGQFIVTLFGITFLTFCLTYLAPGDPVTMLLETADTIVSQELIDETRAQLGLDKPFLVQYANWVVNAAQGDLGMSYSAKKACCRSYVGGFARDSYVSRYIISIYIALCIAGRDYKRLKSKQMDRLSVARCFLCRRVYAIILVRPCTDLYLWP